MRLASERGMDMTPLLLVAGIAVFAAGRLLCRQRLRQAEARILKGTSPASRPVRPRP